MPNSQNGWPVVGTDKIDRTPIDGVFYPNGFLEGDVWKVFNWLFIQLDRRVEAVELGTPKDEWGYYVKNIEGSSFISNHSSGTAGDYNASRHPMGVRNTYSPGQEDEIHKILREADGIFRWGGDYSGRPDEMHFEIIKDAATVHRFVTSLEEKEDEDMGFPSQGDTGEEVRYWQSMYNAVRDGSPLISADGIYGKATSDAFAHWARNHGASAVYPGSSVTAWLAVKWQTAYIEKVAAPLSTDSQTLPFPETQVKTIVSQWLDDKFQSGAFKISGDIDGRVEVR